MSLEIYIKISLCIAGVDLCFNDITDKLKVSPTSTKFKEKLSDSLPNQYRKDEWCFSIKRIGCKRLDELFGELMSVFKSKVALINEICKEYKAEASVVVMTDMINDELPQLVLPYESISFLNSIKAELSFDIYSY